MKCLDNIYTKQIKYNSPVLYQLESLKKEYEKLLKVSNEIIKTGSFIEECYFENQSAVLSDNEITFTGNLKFKTDAGNYFQNIPSSLKLNVQGTGEIVVDVGEDNKTLIFKLDEEFLSEISLMIEDLDSLKEKVNSQVFDNFIGIRNTSDLKIDQIKHMNNNFQITSNDGESLLNIDEQLKTISSFGKKLAYLNEIFPVGSVYLSINNTSPAQIFGGMWEQITDDTYLKIITANGGVLGGTSADHKIPMSSMPKHEHGVRLATITGGNWTFVKNSAVVDKNSSGDIASGNTGIASEAGGGLAYYPYYYGVYAWIRIE